MKQQGSAPSISIDDIERRTVVMRMGLYFMILSLAAGGALWYRGTLSSLAFIIWLALELPVAWVVGTAAWYIIHVASSGFITMLTAAGGTPPEYGFSEQEALVAQGRIDDAIQSYRRYIDDHPGEIEGRLRLAALLASHPGEIDNAEATFLEARVLGGTARQLATLSNGLIDLYHSAGRTAQLKAELARYARAYAGSHEAGAAAERLRRLTDTSAATE